MVKKKPTCYKKRVLPFALKQNGLKHLKSGWNQLIFEDFSSLNQLIMSKPRNHKENVYGDGNVAEKIAQIIQNNLL